VDDTLVLGAGPTGLAAAWRLARAGRPVVLVERETAVGGLCRSLRIDGCCFDIGPHLFKPRSPEVAALWDMLCEGDYAPRRAEATALYFRGDLHRSMRELVLRRPKREIARMGAQLVTRSLWPRPVVSGEDWLRNVRGDAIYEAIYVPREEKVWGTSPASIDPHWYAAQSTGFGARLRDRLAAALSRGAARAGGADPAVPDDPGRYPSRGSGRVYERLGELVSEAPGSRFVLGSEVVRVEHDGARVRAVRLRERVTGEEHRIEAGHFVSTIPLQVLVRAIDPPADAAILADAAKLSHRDLVTVNLVVEPDREFRYDMVYALSADVDVYRITNFAGLSPAAADAAGRLPICLEYPCQRGDAIWRRSDAEHCERAGRELAALGLASARSVVGGEVRRLPEACPVHALGFSQIRARLLRYLAAFGNLQSIGRNGMFTYNQMSHSVDSGLRAAENLLGAAHAIDLPVNDLWL
jgi:protoporphyrinogen oxidase